MKRMVYYFLSFILILLLLPSSIGAMQLKEEVFTWGGNGYDFFNDLIITSDGEYVVAGETFSTNIEGLKSKGRYDAIIVKYDKDGNMIWQKNYGGNDQDMFHAITPAFDGGYIVVGETTSENIAGIESNGHYDAIIVKYDEDGNMVWQKNYGGSGPDQFEDVTQTLDGGYIAVGYTFSQDIEGFENKNTYDYDAIIVKYDKDGNMLWQQSYGGTDDDWLYGITTTSTGDYIAVGFADSYSEILEDNTHIEQSCAVMIKYDKDGNMLWEQCYGGSSTEKFESIISTSDGGYAVVGDTASTDIDGVENNGKDEAIIVKYDKNGNMEWQRSYGGSGYDYFVDVSQTSTGDYFIVGRTNSTDIEGITNIGGMDALVVKYDKNGNLMSQYSYGGSFADIFRGLALTANDEYAIVGYIESKDIEGINHKGVTDGIIVLLTEKYEIKKEETYNGYFDVIQDGNKGKITISPDEGYELDKIIITDYRGTQLTYYKEKDYYYFYMNSDVTVNVTYKRIVENPNTNDFIIISLAVLFISILFGTIWKFTKIRRYNI